VSAAAENDASDEALMTRLRGGDDNALAPLMARWEVPMKRYLARIVQNAHEAEELAQETFVRLYQSRDRFREGARFSPWLYAIAANLARNRLRWWRRRPAVSLEAWTEFGGETADESNAGRAASGAMEQRERAEAVRGAVAALPVELREALVLCEYEGLAQAEAAEALGVTPKAVEMRLYRARAGLRIQLQRWLV
jgi:RNA polymerase sigma factor (sigma-70 family)